jgi:hypothetical protein
MGNNFENYKKDLEKLIDRGELLLYSMQYECYPKEMKKILNTEKAKMLPDFRNEYQNWYSEANIVIKQLLIDRLNDFIRFYEKPRSRKAIDYENYCIEDYLQSLTVSRTTAFGKEIIVDKNAAIPKFKQQISILKSVLIRFSSSLFDIKQLVQADLFDSELNAARELIKHGFFRGAGAIAGVILEKHLTQVIGNHNLVLRKKHPAINDLNELLKNNNTIDVPMWRQIQRFADIRNLCDHNKDREPTKEEVMELIDGIEKTTKVLF